MEHEKRTNDVMNSLEGMQRAEPSPYLYSKIQTRLNAKVEEKIPIRWAFVSMASLVILFILNILFTKPVTGSSTDKNEDIIYEQQLINSDQLY